MLDNDTDESCFISFWRFSFLSRLFLFNTLELISFDQLYLFDDEYDKYGSGYGSPGTCAFPFFSGKYVGSISGVGSDDFVLNGMESIGDVVPLSVFNLRGIESKGR